MHNLEQSLALQLHYLILAGALLWSVFGRGRYPSLTLTLALVQA